MRRGLLVWWSTNTRATSVLATLAAEADVPLALVSDPAAPQPSALVDQASCVLQRPKAPVRPDDLAAIVEGLRQRLRVDQLVLAPTSEYLQDRAHSWAFGERSGPLILASKSTMDYRTLSSKIFLEHFKMSGLPLPTPTRLEGSREERPFVAKPRFNIVAGRAPKPFVVRTEEQWQEFSERTGDYFAQALEPGPSIYWCGFREPDGTVSQYAQENVLQEVGGGSIALARYVPAGSFSEIAALMAAFTQEIDYVGPIMAEFRGPSRRLIEINPRFWGPLLLDAMNDGLVLSAFFRHYFDITSVRSQIVRPSKIYAVPSLVERAVPVGAVFDEQVDGRRASSVSADEAIAMCGWNPAILGGAW